MRRDPGDQGAARVARRLERPPRARDRQRDDELHPHADGRGGGVRHRARRGAAARVCRSRSDGGRDRRRRGGQDGDPRDRRLRLPRRLRRRRPRRHRGDHERPGRGGAPVRADAAPDRLGDARRRPARRPGAALARGRPPPARRRHRRLQRGDAPGRRDPRDHARRPRRGRDGDRLLGRRRHGLDRRHRRDGLPPQRPRLARARAAADRRAAVAVLPPSRGRGPARRARERHRAPGRPRALGRAADPGSDARPAPCSTSSCTRRPRAPSWPRSTSSRRSRESRGRPSALPIVSDRGVAGMGWS